MMEYFHYRSNRIASYTRHPDIHSKHTAKAIQRGVRVASTAIQHYTTRCG